MSRSRLVFDRLTNFPHLEIDTVIPLPRNIRQPIKSLTDLTRQLVQYPGCPQQYCGQACTESAPENNCGYLRSLLTVKTVFLDLAS